MKHQSSRRDRGRAGHILGARDWWSNSPRGARVALSLVSVVWGATFPLNKVALQHQDVFAFIADRFLVACLALGPMLFRRSGIRTANPRSIAVAILAGLVLFVSLTLQSEGLRSISAADSGFITGLNVVIVPFLGYVLGSRPSRSQLGAAFLAFVGLVILTNPGRISLSGGEMETLGGAVGVALQIQLTQYGMRYLPAALFTMIELVVTAGGSVLSAIVLDGGAGSLLVGLGDIEVVAAILIGGIVATAFALYVQSHYQQRMSATEVAVIYSLEPLFAAGFASIFLEEVFGVASIIGGGLIILGMFFSSR